MPGDAAHQGRRDRDANGRRDEIVQGKPHHLSQIRQRRFASVRLPVGVGRETDGRIEGQIGGHRSESLRVEGQPVLQSQDGVGEKAADQAQEQHGERVLPPILFLIWIDADEPIGEPLEGLESSVQPGAAVRVEHLGQIEPHRFSDGCQREDVEEQFNPAVVFHRLLELFRSDQSDQQVDDQEQGDERDDQVLHRSFIVFRKCARKGR